VRDVSVEKLPDRDKFRRCRRATRLIKIRRTGCSLRYPNVMQRPVWISTRNVGSDELSFCLSFARERTDEFARQAQGGGDGTKIASLFLQAQLLLFSQNSFGKARPGHRVKVFSEVIGAVRGCGMKRRTARQLVRLLSDIRHAAHCSTLRAAATNREIALASAERQESPTDSQERDETPEATREAPANKPTRSGS